MTIIKGKASPALMCLNTIEGRRCFKALMHLESFGFTNMPPVRWVLPNGGLGSVLSDSQTGYDNALKKYNEMAATMPVREWRIEP